MMYHNRIDLAKGTDSVKSNNSEKCIVCHYLVFNHRFKFHNSVYNDLTVLCPT